LQTFEELLAEGENVPVEGWAFWFNGRASEERPSPGHSRIIAERMATAHVALDIQTGGDEVLAEFRPHRVRRACGVPLWTATANHVSSPDRSRTRPSAATNNPQWTHRRVPPGSIGRTGSTSGTPRPSGWRARYGTTSDA